MSTDPQTQIAQLEARVAELEAQLAVKAKKAPPKVSPLAPKDGFPDLPKVEGVSYSAVEAGVKYKGRLDVMMAKVDAGSSVAGVFTTSSTRSGPVLWCQEQLAGPLAGKTAHPVGIVVNSGNSNAFTGGQGFRDVEKTAQSAAEALGCPADHVLIASTGVIGEPLKVSAITAKMEELVAGLSVDAAALAARAIMTTDTYAKGAFRKVTIGGAEVTVSGFAKGSGMIAPDMATMLVFIFTDAKVSPQVLRDILASKNSQTFNAITVDSDTSTSDSLVLAATGRADMAEITDAASQEGAAFAAALGDVMQELAHLVVKDGEGATKFVEIEVTGAVSDASAHKIGLAIANSPLVKTAIAGEDPNWGRVVMAVGKSGEPAERDLLTISFGDILVAEKGWVAASYTEDAGAAYMKNEELRIGVEIGLGEGRATVWTCDLTHQYISINADYRS